MVGRRVLILLAMCFFAATPYAWAAEPDAAAVEYFENHVRPLFAAKCWMCHGAEKQEASLRLDSAAGVATGGDSGPPILPGDPEHSPMIVAVRYEDEPRMPPDARLSDDEVATLATWIRDGARWPTYPESEAPPDDGSTAERLLAEPVPEGESDPLWAFRPVADPPEPPSVPGARTERLAHRSLHRCGAGRTRTDCRAES